MGTELRDTQTAFHLAVDAIAQERMELWVSDSRHGFGSCEVTGWSASQATRRRKNGYLGRFRCKSGVWGRVLEALGGDGEFANLWLDSTIVRAHQHAAGVNGARLPRIGTLPWGLQTKIYVAVTGEGQPVTLHLTEGERHDVTSAEALLEGLELEHVIADKGYDSDPLCRDIRSAGAEPVIPSRRDCRTRRHDSQRYKLRNVVERLINRLKHCRRVATRYDKLAATFLGFVQFASTVTLPLNVHTT